MGKPTAKPTMMRFEPEAGWRDVADIIPVHEHAITDAVAVNAAKPGTAAGIPTAGELQPETLVEIGESMQEVFDSLKISDPRLQAWTQVHAAIRLISGKLDEQRALQVRLAALAAEIEGVRSLAAELVRSACRAEQEIHQTSKLRMQLAESLSEKLSTVFRP